MSGQINDSVRQLSGFLRRHANGNGKLPAPTFDLICDPVERQASIHGLTDDEFNTIINALVKFKADKCNLTSSAMTKIIHLCIPAQRPPKRAVEKLLIWFMSYWRNMPKQAAKTTFMWFIAALKYELIQPEDINWCYDVFFQSFDIKYLNLQLCTFLELLTTPNLITKYRTRKLHSQMLLHNQSKGPIIHLLSLFKTLRPDKVPMQVPIITSGFLGSTGEKKMTEQLAVCATRAEGIYNYNSIRWALKKKAGILPQITYFADAAQKDKGKVLMDCATVNDIALNILTARTPAQLLSLTTSPEALFFLRFHDDKEIKLRFDYVLHRMFLEVDNLYYDPNYEEEVIDLLKCLAVKQDIDLSGSPVITKFVRHFVSFIQNPILLPLVMKLFTRPHFTDAEDLSQTLLKYTEIMFYPAVYKQKLLIIESLWTLVDNLLLQFVGGVADDFSWEPTKTLNMMLSLIEKMYNYCIATRGVVGLGHLKHSAIVHYLELFDKEAVLDESFKLITFAPTGLFVSCFITGPSWLAENCCSLLLKYTEQVKGLSTANKAKLKSKIIGLEEVNLCLFDMLFKQAKSKSKTMLRRVMDTDSIPVISRSIMKKDPILRYFGLLPQRLTSENELRVEWTLPELLEFCSVNYKSFYEIVATMMH